MSAKKTTVVIIIGCALLVLFLVWFLAWQSPIDNGPTESIAPSKLTNASNQSLKVTPPGLTPIRLSNDQLSLAITNQPLQTVAKAIAQQAKVSILFDQGMPNPNIDITFTDLPIEQGLRRLLWGFDSFFLYSNDKGASAKLSAVWVYPKGTGKMFSPSPIAQATNAQKPMIDANDPEPLRRALAIASAIEQIGQGDKDVLLAALNDPEEIVRVNALQTADISAMTMPADVLTDLALHDPSATVRSMALASLLTSYEEGRTSPNDIAYIADLAQNDPEPVVAELARQIISSLEAAPEESVSSIRGDVEDDPQRAGNLR